MQKVTINKAKLAKGLHLEVDYSQHQNGSVDNVSQACSADVHDDLRAAFKKLAPHLAALTEQFDKEGKLVDTIECRGFSIKGDDEAEGITLTGLRNLSSGRTITLNSPFLKWNSDVYGDVDQLQEDVDAAIEEVREYLFNNKHKSDDQMGIFDNVEENN